MRGHQVSALDGRTEEVDVIRHQRFNDEQNEYVRTIGRKERSVASSWGMLEETHAERKLSHIMHLEGSH